MFTLGESITAGGWASNRERCWASQLARTICEYQREPVQLVNMGIGANVISTKSSGFGYSGKPAASERVDQHILEYHASGTHLVPDLLIISYGLNDARSGTPIDLFTSEMEDIVQRVREKIQPLIVLVGPYYMNDFTLGGRVWSHGNLEVLHKYNEATKQLAVKVDCLFVNLLSSYREADWLVHHDGVHANDLGHRLVANKIFEVLASNCSGLAQETKYLEQHIVPWRDESTLQTDFE
ncbi:MAG: SGNH/GDSL hydrolase family protein [Armatimonadota bacterium]